MGRYGLMRMEIMETHYSPKSSGKCAYTLPVRWKMDIVENRNDIY
jgi:hypothetical protein